MRLPNFVIAGAAKAGTTSLYHYLGQHPDVFMSPVKEPNFFSFEGQTLRFNGPSGAWLTNSSVTDLDAYRNLFAAARADQARGEASPLYLYYERTPYRMRHHCPAMKVILVLRNPVDRAYSHFWHMHKYGLEFYTDFEAALAAEPQRQRQHWTPGFFYKDLGFYYAAVERYLDVFGPHQVKLYLYEEFSRDTAAVVRDVFEFVGVDAAFRPRLSLRHNASGPPKNRILRRLMTSENRARSLFRGLPLPVKKYLYTHLWSANVSRPAMKPETRSCLASVYRDDLLKLQDLIGRDLGSWLRA